MTTTRDGTYTLYPTPEGPLESVGDGWFLNGEPVSEERARALIEAMPKIVIEAGDVTWG